MTKTGRNAPCPCGSGKQYKKCCLEKDRLKEWSAPAVLKEADHIGATDVIDDEAFEVITAHRIIELLAWTGLQDE